MWDFLAPVQTLNSRSASHCSHDAHCVTQTRRHLKIHILMPRGDGGAGACIISSAMSLPPSHPRQPAQPGWNGSCKQPVIYRVKKNTHTHTHTHKHKHSVPSLRLRCTSDQSRKKGRCIICFISREWPWLGPDLELPVCLCAADIIVFGMAPWRPRSHIISIDTHIMDTRNSLQEGIRCWRHTAGVHCRYIDVLLVSHSNEWT